MPKDNPTDNPYEVAATAIVADPTPAAPKTRKPKTAKSTKRDDKEQVSKEKIEDKLVIVNLKIPESARKKLKMCALSKGVTISQLFIEMLDTMPVPSLS